MAIVGDRGRRSRRRRGRGRGFPDSKYASADASTPAPVPGCGTGDGTERLLHQSQFQSQETRPSPASAGATDFSVLPGESLAKYTRSNIQPLDEAEEDEIRDLQETTRRSPNRKQLAEIAEEAVEEPDDAPSPRRVRCPVAETGESKLWSPAEEIYVRRDGRGD